MKIGAYVNDRGNVEFTVWAPLCKSVELKITSPSHRILPMEKDSKGYWTLESNEIKPGARYYYRLNGNVDRPDPASQYQHCGVHRCSEVVDHSTFVWTDETWQGIPLEKLVLYELHVGTFSPEGTFKGVINKLDYLIDLGVTAIEIMPVAQFPGDRNWGYDGAYPFAVQDSYGGPTELKELVDTCHKKGISAFLDVVYNHFGPEGAYAHEYGPFFTDKYNTPWGAAINYDDAWSDGVRNFVVQNALYWLDDYHFDGLRLDAIHGIYDLGAKHILKEIAEDVDKLSKLTGKKRLLIAESDLNDVRVIMPFELNGHGMDAQWSDDFHHSVHSLLTGESRSYYGDYGTIDHLIKAYKEGFVYSWNYSKNRKHHHGSSSASIQGKQLVICTQNHDQVGNRLLGERLSMLVSFEACKLAAAAMFVAPYIPLLFMGEELFAKSPFLYFISHSDEHLVQLVREGREREFAEFHWSGKPIDPQDQATFNKCKIDWGSTDTGNHKTMHEFYKTLLSLRKKIPTLSKLDKTGQEIDRINDSVLKLVRNHNESEIHCFLNFSEKESSVLTDSTDYSAQKLLDSSDRKWNGPGETMPDRISPEKEYRIPGYGFVMYQI